MIDYKMMTADQLFDYENYHLGDLVSRLYYFSSDEAGKEYHICAIDDGAIGAPIVGIVGIQQNPYDDEELWFKHVSVDERYRGQGIGRTLTRLVMEHVVHETNKRIRFSDFERDSVRGMVYQLAERFPDVEMVTTDMQPINIPGFGLVDHKHEP